MASFWRLGAKMLEGCLVAQCCAVAGSEIVCGFNLYSIIV